MIDRTPFIIVDNQKIMPLERTADGSSQGRPRHRSDARPFGVVDRVTISAEAREKLRLRQASSDLSTAEAPKLAGDPATAAYPRLTYSPLPDK